MATPSSPPVPQKLREMLKDYPEHIQMIKDDLSGLVAKPFKGTPIFEQAVWVLENNLSSFISQARNELKVAEVGGDPAAIERANAKVRLMLRARLGIGGIPDLFEYFQDNKGKF